MWIRIRNRSEFNDFADPDYAKILDPDPYWIMPDPQPWLIGKKDNFLSHSISLLFKNILTLFQRVYKNNKKSASGIKIDNRK
jgi:hypothetical protein